MLPASPAKKRTGSRILAQVVTKGSACLTAALLSVVAQAAEGLKYEVRIDAPSDVRDLLEHNLDLVRFRGNDRIDREQLQRLVRVAPEQIRTLVATDGYYSPVVSATMDREAAGTPVVQVKEVPGEPVRVGEVDLSLQGFVPNPEQPADKQFDVNTLKATWPHRRSLARHREG